MALGRLRLIALILTLLPGIGGARDESEPAFPNQDMTDSFEAKGRFLSSFRELYRSALAAIQDRGLEPEFAGHQDSMVEDEVGQREPPFLLISEDPPIESPYFPGPNRPAENGNTSTLRKVKVNLDTGDLTGPDGKRLPGIRMKQITVVLSGNTRDGEEFCRIKLSRDFASDKRILVTVICERRNGRVFCQDLLKTIEADLERKQQERRKQGNPGERKTGGRGRDISKSP